MKQIIHILFMTLLLVSLSCQKETVAPRYKTLEGNWELTTPIMTANFTIDKVGTDYVVNKGSYALLDQGHSTWHYYTVASEFVIPTNFRYIHLQEANPGYYMAIDYLVISTDFTTIDAQSASSGSLVNQNITSFKVRLTRSL